MDGAGCRDWFVAGLPHQRMRVRPRSKLVNFHDAEINAMWYDYTACKRSPEYLFGLGALGKLHPSIGWHRQS
ncbi:hypothetical protein TNCV_3103301 [Trichonephila clavipes]|nr:hypothetical protein TNCV_3103301 [Trichonephila clavipes]